MALNTGRKMTDGDGKRLEAAAGRFMKKHGIEQLPGLSNLQTVESVDLDSDMQADWNARIKRALRGYTRWGYGYVGDSA